MLNALDPVGGSSRIAVVLVRARNPNNIGAVARAMHDFGFSDLRVVNEYTMPLEGARSAVDASSVLHAATVYRTVAEAVADCTMVVGTTAVGERDLTHPLSTLAHAAATIRTALAEDDQSTDDQSTDDQSARVAILFGSEKTGLSNEELSHCNFLLTIPMHRRPDARHLSMNLGQAVAVCLYELVRERELARESRPDADASAAERERLTTLLAEVLEASEYTRHHPANASVVDLRRLVLRLKLSRTDVSVWMGILRQALWKLHN